MAELGSVDITLIVWIRASAFGINCVSWLPACCSVLFVRLKIKQGLRGIVDGRQLDRFEVGHVYEVGTSLANYLLAINAAEPTEDRPPTEPEIDEDASAETRKRIGADQSSAPHAHDKPRTRFSRRPRKRR